MELCVSIGDWNTLLSIEDHRGEFTSRIITCKKFDDWFSTSQLLDFSSKGPKGALFEILDPLYDIRWCALFLEALPRVY